MFNASICYLNMGICKQTRFQSKPHVAMCGIAIFAASGFIFQCRKLPIGTVKGSFLQM